MLRRLTENDVSITVECLSEDLPIYGNCMASGDDIFDRECADEIRADLENGNEWAWCVVKVSVQWRDWRESAYLGGCSYRSREDFQRNGADYLGDLVAEALGELNKAITRDFKFLSELQS